MENESAQSIVLSLLFTHPQLNSEILYNIYLEYEPMRIHSLQTNNP